MTVSDRAVIFSKRMEDGFGLRGRGKVMRRISDGTKHYRLQTLAAL